MLKFHSPYLDSFTPKNPAGDRKVIKTRCLWFLCCLAVLGVLIAIAASRTLAKAGWVYYVYWFHDFIYLPVKAYGYRYFFPLSLIWLGIFFGTTITWLVFFLAHRAFWRKPHGDLLGWVLQKPLFFPLLRATAAWQRGRGFFPGMLLAAVGRARRTLLWQWYHDHSGPRGHGLSEKLGRMTHLEMDLRQSPEIKMAPILASVRIWREVFCALAGFYTDQSPPPWLITLSERLYPLVKKVLPVDDEARFRGLLEREADFFPETLLVDLLFLAAIFDREAAGKALGAAAAGPLHHRIKLIAGRLFRSGSTRQALLDGVRLQVEAPFRQTRGSDPSRFFFTLPPVEDENLECLGHLALGLSLDLALLADLPEQGIAFIESVQALNLALEITDPQLQDSESWFRLAALIRHQPSPADFLRCAFLEERRQWRRMREWERSPLFREGSLDHGDFALARGSVAALYQSTQLEEHPLLGQADAGTDGQNSLP